jgi:hypothetical protein
VEQVVWSREEGLSRVTASLFVDFPLVNAEGNNELKRDHFGFRKLVLSITDVRSESQFYLLLLGNPFSFLRQEFDSFFFVEALIRF